MGFGNLLGEGNDIFIFLIIFLLLFNGSDSSCGDDSDNIIFFLLIFLLLFNGSGNSGHCGHC